MLDILICGFKIDYLKKIHMSVCDIKIQMLAYLKAKIETS